MSIINTIERVNLVGEEEFILARDEKHAESMRVSAFNIRRKMPPSLSEDIGIQKITENNLWFLRIFKRGLDEAQHFRRDLETGTLIQIKAETINLERERMIMLMKRDGKTEEEIKSALGED
jgi:hypothetical protein